MSGIMREQVEQYLKGQGHPQPDVDGTLDEFMNGGEMQAMYDEAVRNNYALPDVNRWFHLVKVMGIEMPFKTAMAIDGALYEADLETLELNLPEERLGLGKGRCEVLNGSFAEVKVQIKDQVEKGIFPVGRLTRVQTPGLTLEDSFKLYAELRGEMDGSKTIFLTGPDQMWDLSRVEFTRLEDHELRDIVKDYVDLSEHDPLGRFIEKEVPWRLQFVHDLDVSEDVCDLVAHALKNQHEVMFDYDRLDGFIKEQYAAISCVDVELLKKINAEIEQLQGYLWPDDLPDGYVPEEQKELDKLVAIRDCMMAAGKLGVTLRLEPDRVRDLEHLEPVWFSGAQNGEIGSLDYKGYQIRIEAQGDAAFAVLDEKLRDVIFSYRSQDGKGTFGNEELMAVVPNDDMLRYLEGEGRLDWIHNNWFECFVFDGDGVEVGCLNRVLEGNLLGVFNQAGALAQMIDDFTHRREQVAEKMSDGYGGKFVFDDELMINDDFESINGYLWAMDYLVDKLPGTEDMENINFYADFDVRNGEIALTATYYTPTVEGEVQREVAVPLSTAEQAELIGALEGYCQKKYRRSCREFIDEVRTGERFGDGLALVFDKENGSTLDDQIKAADALRVSGGVDSGKVKEQELEYV